MSKLNRQAVMKMNHIHNLLATYTWGIDLSRTLQGAGGVGGLLSTNNNQLSTVSFPAYDANGNVSEYLDAAATIAAHYEYGPFGETLRATGAMAEANPFRFSTKYYDEETSLFYYGYRYYQPQTGRWLSRDSLAETGGVNLYGIGSNNVINQIDILGLKIVGGRNSDKPGDIVALDKTFTGYETTNYVSDNGAVACWSVSGNLGISSTGTSDQIVSVYPTSVSSAVGDSRITAVLSNGTVETLRVTIRRPFAAQRSTPVAKWHGWFVHAVEVIFTWTITDQFGEPVPFVTVEEQIVSSGFPANTASGPTDENGVIYDKYSSYIGANLLGLGGGIWSINQTLIIGGWRTEPIPSYLLSNGEFNGVMRGHFH